MDPDISFVVPAYNEEQYIRQCIDSIDAAVSTAGISHEIIVIDNGSTDQTAPICRSLGVQVVSTSRKSVSKARNLGASLAQSDVLAFIDADVRITQTWALAVKKSLPRLRGLRLITGARYVVSAQCSWIERNWFTPLTMRTPSYINGGNVIVSKKTYETLDGFRVNIETGEDVDLCERAKVAGCSVEHNRDFVAIHDGYPCTIRAFFRRELWHGKGDAQEMIRGRFSPVTISTLLFAVLHALLALSFLWDVRNATLIIAIIIPSMILAMSTRIFYRNGLSYVLINMGLCYIYLCARCFSFAAIALPKRG